MRIDPELEHQLTLAETKVGTADSAAIEAVFLLEGAFNGKGEVDAKNIKKVVDRLLKRVQKETGEKVHDVHVFQRLGSFVVKAPPRLLRSLLAENGVIRSARANRSTSGSVSML